MKTAKEAEICLYDVIDSFFGISAKEFRRQLADAGDVNVIHCRINSPGGSVWDGLAIHNTLKSHKAKVIVHIDGLAASMASIVAMAGDEIEMPANSFMMLHNPSDIAAGDAEEIRKTADLLDQVKEQLAAIYAARSGKDAKEIEKLMDEETWLDGATAVDMGLATKCIEPLATAASIDRGRLAAYRNVPATLVCAAPTQPPTSTTGAPIMAEPTATEPKAATLKELRAACPGADEKFLCAQLEADATVAQACTAWMTAQAKALEDLKKELKANKSGKPGVAPPPTNGKKKGKGKKEPEGDEDDCHDCDDDNDDDTQNVGGEDPDMDDLLQDDPIGKFDRLVTDAIKKQAATGRAVDRLKAVQTVATKNPALHHAYLVASNGGSKRIKRLMEEKFEGFDK
jgi:ATP-dependent Clp endopeptidase proteolytic subunit ClpP